MFHIYYDGVGDNQARGLDDYLNNIQEAIKYGVHRISANIRNYGLNLPSYVKALAACKNLGDLVDLKVFSQSDTPFHEIHNAIDTLIEVLETNPQLESLTLQGLHLPINADSMRLFKAIAQHPNLNKISFHGSAFADEDAQVYFFKEISMMSNLQAISLIGKSDFNNNCAGLVDFVGANKSVRNLHVDSIDDLHVIYLSIALQANHESKIKRLSIGSDKVELSGEAIITIFNLLNTRHHGNVELDFGGAIIHFQSMADATKLFTSIMINLKATVNFKAGNIGTEVARYDDQENPFIKDFNDKIMAFLARNYAISTAEYMSCDNSELASFVYLAHLDKYERIFSDKLVEATPVSLKVRCHFNLFKENPAALEPLQDSWLAHCNAYVNENKSKFKL